MKAPSGGLAGACGVALLLVALAAGRVHAGGPSTRAGALPAQMRIEYSRAPGAEACRDEAAFRAAVVRRLMHHPDPFAAGAQAGVTVALEGAVTPQGRRYAGHWEVRDGAGRLLFSEEIPLGAMNVDCGPVVEGLAFKLAYWLEAGAPDAIATSSAASAPGEAAASAEASSSSVPATSAEPSRPPVKEAFVPPPLPQQRFDAMPSNPAAIPAVGSEGAAPAGRAGKFFVSAAGLAGLALTPSPAGGGAIGFGWRARWWSVAAEGRVFLSLRSRLVNGDAVGLYDFVRVTGALVPCLRFRWLMGCGVIDMGVLHVDAAPGVRNTRSPSDHLALGIGGRIAAELPIGPFAVRAGIDVLGAPRPNRIVVEGAEVWRQGLVGAIPWAGVAVMF